MPNFPAGQIIYANDLNDIATPGSVPIETLDLSDRRTFSEIPQDYQHLVILIEGNVTDAYRELWLRFNEDNSSNYTSMTRTMPGDGSVNPSPQLETTTLRFARIGTNFRSSCTLTIPNYTSTFTKSCHSVGFSIDGTGSDSDIGVVLGGGIWTGNDPIETIEINVIGGGNSFSTGTTATMHGLNG